MTVRIKSIHTQGQLRIGCGELVWLSGDQSRQFFACVRELISKYSSRRDVILDLEPIVLISLEGIEELLQLKAVLASENRGLAVVNLRPIVAEMLRNISASDLLAAGCAASEESVILCPSEVSL